MPLLSNPDCSKNPSIAINEIVLLDCLFLRNDRLQRKAGISITGNAQTFASPIRCARVASKKQKKPQH